MRITTRWGAAGAIALGAITALAWPAPAAATRRSWERGPDDHAAWRVRPGRFLAGLEPPGVGVPIEAVVDGPGDPERASVFVHLRPLAGMDWERRAMRRLEGDPRRFQAVLPCAPCGARPQHWFELVVRDEAGTARDVGWWPPEGPSRPVVHDVGHETWLAGDAGAWLVVPGRRGLDVVAADRAFARDDARSRRDRPRGPVTGAWVSPRWRIPAATDVVVQLTWRVEATGGGRGVRLLGRSDREARWRPWAILEAADDGRRELLVDVDRHAAGAVWIELRAEPIGRPGGVATVGPVQLVARRCDPGVGPDVDRDGRVGFGDVLAVLGAWGGCRPDAGGGCDSDVDGDGTVAFGDLLGVLAAWTPDVPGLPGADA